MATIEEALAIAIEHHQRGRLAEAEGIYLRILEQQAEHAQVFGLLGAINLQRGRSELAVEWISRALALRPDWPQALSNRGEALRVLGRLDESIADHRRAVALDPNSAQAHYNFGVALKARGDVNEAILAYRRAIALKPDYAKAFGNLGNALREKRQLDESIAALRRAVALQPHDADVHVNLATALRERGLVDEAIIAGRQAITIRPGELRSQLLLANLLREKGLLTESVAACRAAVALSPQSLEACICLGNALIDSRQFDEAIAVYRRAIVLRPDHAESYASLGCALAEGRRPDEAIAVLQQAVALKPDLATAYNHLGNALKDQARLDEALVAYRRAAELDPNDPGAHSNLVYTMQFCSEYDAGAISTELRRWDERHARPLKRFIKPVSPPGNQNGRLRIGYVSPDFQGHVVGLNLLPLFENHDRRKFEITCYAQVARPDAVTARFRRHADRWCNIFGLTDAQVAEQIKRDGIDILVDLTLHMSGNRLLVFARKPAPIQVTFAGYPGSTGLSAMDYRLSDPYLDPPGISDSLYIERTIRLADSFWCYAGMASREVPVSPLPATSSNDGAVTFGCLNNFCKVNAATLGLWAQVMRQVPSSRLILLANEGGHQNRTRDFLAGEGVEGNRVEFAPRQDHRGYLELYHRIDIGLDSFPYNGHTTSMDSFWMGVPVVTLVGQTAIARAGWCQLSNLKLTELASDLPQEFVAKAVGLARDLPRLREIRSTLRSRMEASPLMDAKGFARNVEDAYRRICPGRLDHRE